MLQENENPFPIQIIEFPPGKFIYSAELDLGTHTLTPLQDWSRKTPNEYVAHLSPLWYLIPLIFSEDLIPGSTGGGASLLSLLWSVTLLYRNPECSFPWWGGFHKANAHVYSLSLRFPELGSAKEPVPIRSLNEHRQSGYILQRPRSSISNNHSCVNSNSLASWSVFMWVQYKRTRRNGADFDYRCTATELKMIVFCYRFISQINSSFRLQSVVLTILLSAFQCKNYPRSHNQITSHRSHVSNDNPGMM